MVFVNFPCRKFDFCTKYYAWSFILGKLRSLTQDAEPWFSLLGFPQYWLSCIVDVWEAIYSCHSPSSNLWLQCSTFFRIAKFGCCTCRCVEVLVGCGCAMSWSAMVGVTYVSVLLQNLRVDAISAAPIQSLHAFCVEKCLRRWMYNSWCGTLVFFVGVPTILIVL